MVALACRPVSDAASLATIMCACQVFLSSVFGGSVVIFTCTHGIHSPDARTVRTAGMVVTLDKSFPAVEGVSAWFTQRPPLAFGPPVCNTLCTWLQGKKRRKQVDRKASKGRKLRFHVHEKLVGFMAPMPATSHQMSQQLFSNLFGAKHIRA